MKDFLLKNLERVMNRYLRLDPESGMRLQKLAGKIVTLELVVARQGHPSSVSAARSHLLPQGEKGPLKEDNATTRSHSSLKAGETILFSPAERGPSSILSGPSPLVGEGGAERRMRGNALKLQLKFQEQKILLQHPVENPDVTITGTPISLLHLSFSNKSQRKKFFSEDVLLDGDLELGQQIIDLMDEMEIDWEEHLSQITGDVIANQIGRFAKATQNFIQRTKETLLQNINEYVHEEVNLFPPREALEDFFKEIDTLRMAADRLELQFKKVAE